MIIQEDEWTGLQVTDHQLEVPRDWQQPDAGSLSVFFREVASVEKRHQKLPLLVFLQGGPGGKSPRPTATGPSWLHEALKHYRVILPDQRGTGRSSRITDSVMAGFDSATAAADYLACFDAHAIVADLEHIRHHVYGGERWHTLGQSYGGFLTLTYLSWAADGLASCHIAGGLAALAPDADAVYGRTYRTLAAKLEAHCKRFPGDRARLDRIADRIEASAPQLPNGDTLTVRRFQTLGLMLGMSDGSERLHWLLEEAFADARQRTFNRVFLLAVMTLTGLDDNPLFAAIHEHIYANPVKTCDWAADRLKPEPFAATKRPLYLTGEMIYPWMFEDISALRPFRDGVQLLAQRRLAASRPYYRPEVLAQNRVPVAAVIYHDDMYVDRELSLQTAAAVNHLVYWITNEYEHDGLRQDPRVFKRLLAMNAGR